MSNDSVKPPAASTWLLKFAAPSVIVRFTFGTGCPASVGVPPVQTKYRSPRCSVRPSALTGVFTEPALEQLTAALVVVGLLPVVGNAVRQTPEEHGAAAERLMNLGTGRVSLAWLA